MVVDRSDKVTLRIGRLELTLLGWALLISLVAHLMCWGGYELVKRYDLSAKLHLPAWMQRLMSPPPPVAQTPPPKSEPFMFIDVRDAQSVAEPPKNAIRYSDLNAMAANPDANKATTEPKIDGEKNELQKTDDAGLRKRFDQLMPDPAKPEQEERPETKHAPGTMTVAKADLRPPQERQRPRTLREALAKNNQSPGRRSQQDGGASRRGEISFDVKMTGFGSYDRALIDAVRNHWYNVLDSLSADNYQQGKVVVQFDLDYKGRALNVRVIESTVSESLAMWCQKAISDPSPYGEWTREMRMAVGEDSRNIKFTFFYY